MLLDGSFWSCMPIRRVLGAPLGNPGLATGAERWFPTRYMIIGVQKTFHLVLKDIKINQPISDDQFAPEIPFGTLITGGPGTTPW